MRNLGFIVFLFIGCLGPFKALWAQSASHRYASEYTFMDFNNDPPSAHDRVDAHSDSAKFVISTHSDSSGQLKYLFCSDSHLDSKGGIYDTLGNLYYGTGAQERFTYGIKVAPGQLLLLGHDSLLLVAENDLTKVLKLYKRRVSFSWPGTTVRKYRDTCYIVSTSFDSLFIIKAAKNYVSSVKSTSIDYLFNNVKSKANDGNRVLRAHIDFNSRVNRLSIAFQRLRYGNNPVPDSIEAVLTVADFNKGNLNLSNHKVYKRGLTVCHIFTDKVIREEPLVRQALFAPNDSSLYFTEEYLIYDEEGDVDLHQNFKVKRLHLHSKNEVLLEGFADTKNNTLFARIYRGANNKIYYSGRRSDEGLSTVKEISYPNASDADLEIHTLYRNRHIGHYSFEQNYYEPMVEAHMVKRCPQPVFSTSHYEQPDSILWQLYTHGDSQLVATGRDERFSPTIPKTGTYIMRITHYRHGFAQYLWQKYKLDAPLSAGFALKDTVGCRYNPLAIENTSQFDPTTIKQINWQWHFKRPLGNIDVYSGFEPEMKPVEQGVYRLHMIAGNKYCSDTTAKLRVHVQNAHAPGFNASPGTACLYDEIVVKAQSTSALVDSFRYYWNEELGSTLADFRYQPKRAGKHYLHQKIYSKGGCLTEAWDTLFINHGFSELDTQTLHYITVSTDTSIRLHFAALPHGSHREVFLSDTRIDSFGAQVTSYHHHPLNVKRTYTYSLRGFDSCGSVITTERHSNVVFDFNNQNNHVLILNWSKYIGWTEGKNFYRIEYSPDLKTWHSLGEVSNTNYSLNTGLLDRYDSVYLNIVAGNTENSYNSHSNVVLADLRNTLFIPNAFSPNGDGVNDTFALGHFGYESFECRIYAHNGQLVAHSTNPGRIWDGKGADGTAYPIGEYIYIIEAINHQGEPLKYVGTVFVLQ